MSPTSPIAGSTVDGPQCPLALVTSSGYDILPISSQCKHPSPARHDSARITQDLHETWTSKQHHTLIAQDEWSDISVGNGWPLTSLVSTGTCTAQSFTKIAARSKIKWNNLAECPVLHPLAPYISSFMSAWQAQSLLESYFSSQFQTGVHPRCPHVHAFLFRKESFMTTNRPRKCNAALLASMLWIVVETGDRSSTPWLSCERKSVGGSLERVVLELLRGLDITGAPFDSYNGENLPIERDESEALDNVIAFIHVATVLSTRNTESGGLRWWDAALALAREIGLNEEKILDTDDLMSSACTPPEDFFLETWMDLDLYNLTDMGGSQHHVSLEQSIKHQHQLEALETRRRTWWLLYIQDRHLALRFNRRHVIYDDECQSLLLPLDEDSWQSGSCDPVFQPPSFPSLQCTGYDIFGWFLPLMTIAGLILDYHSVRDHHTLGKYSSNHSVLRQRILDQLQTYEKSLARFEHVPSMTGTDCQHAKIMVAYAKYFTQILRIILTGTCLTSGPPVCPKSVKLPPDFTTIIYNALTATENVRRILDVDPDTSFIPYFLGIQLFQGSFPLVHTIYQSQGRRVHTRILEACEVVIHALEVSISTMRDDRQVRTLQRRAASTSDLLLTIITERLSAAATSSCGSWEGP